MFRGYDPKCEQRMLKKPNQLCHCQCHPDYKRKLSAGFVETIHSIPLAAGPVFLRRVLLSPMINKLPLQYPHIKLTVRRELQDQLIGSLLQKQYVHT